MGSSYRTSLCGVQVRHLRWARCNLHEHHNFLFLSLGSDPRRSINLATWQLLLKGDSIGRPLRTLLEKVDAKAWGVGTKNSITLVKKNAIAAGA